LTRFPRVFAVVMAVAVPAAAWDERGALFGIVAFLTFAPMILLGTFARGWLLRPRGRGPRALAPLGALPVVPLGFVACGLVTDWPPLTCLLPGAVAWLGISALALVRHPGSR